MNNSPPLGRPSGIGLRYVVKRFKTAGTYSLILPVDFQPSSLLDFVLISGAGDGGPEGGGLGGSPGGGGGGGGGVKGSRWNLCSGLILPLVVGAKTAASSITFPPVAGGTASATGGATGTNGGAGAAGVGSGNTTFGDLALSGVAGQNPIIVGWPCTGNIFFGGMGGCPPFLFTGMGGFGGISAVAADGAYAPVNGGGPGNGGGGAYSGSTVGTGQPGYIEIGAWTADPNYLPTVT